jgi:DNA-binding beta-propeller fold protein YncE/mono/diheme cytochrome c family protein
MRIRLMCKLGLTLWLTAVSHAEAFWNFETGLVHPLALSPDRTLMAVCNLPDACVELFDLTGNVPRPVGAVATGLDPVSVRFNGNGELWVANSISDSISVIDVIGRRTVAILQTADAPSDILFTTGNRAYVSAAGANVVEVWDTTTRARMASIDIDGDRPKAMALSRDASEIYVAILESGNCSTIIAPELVATFALEPPSVLDDPNNPQGGGRNPFPNDGDKFSPPISSAIPATNAPPKVSLIVRKQNGRWMDDNHGDWTEYISGTNAALTGRVTGWDVADHDVAIINTTTHATRYVRGLMNICFDLAVNPASGKLAVVGTDGKNEIRFTPNLQSTFIQMKLAFVNPTDSSKVVSDLNPHLDYQKRSLPLAEKRRSVGEPRAIAWNSRGDRGYVAGLGSDNLIAIDPNGNRVGEPVQIPAGPTGILLDDEHNRLYVFSRFAAALVTLQADNLAILHTNFLHDATPAPIRNGRKHFYGTANSGLGQAACASCHVDGRFDRLAWDLGNPAGEMKTFTNRMGLRTWSTFTYHPMMGPRVTQTLVDIIGHEPFHWRADRDGIEAFAPTFVELQGADAEPSAQEMQEFEDFLATLTFPPNRYRNFDNTLPTEVALVGEFALGHNQLPAGQLMPKGNAVSGFEIFKITCTGCHTINSGLGTDGLIISQGLPDTVAPSGPNGERFVATIALPRALNLPFKVPQLREISEKRGFSLRGPVSRAGFGFMHDGRMDTLTHFLESGFPGHFNLDWVTADTEAFLLALRGSDLAQMATTEHQIGPASRDVPAATGFQTILTSSDLTDKVAAMIDLTGSSTGRLELIVRAMRNGQSRAWLRRGDFYMSDKSGETSSLSEALAHATPDAPVELMLVPSGSGVRLALDRDEDSIYNQDEIDSGSDPADPDSTPETRAPRLLTIKLNGTRALVQFYGKIGARYQVEMRDEFDPSKDWVPFGPAMTLQTTLATSSQELTVGTATRFYRVVHIP